MTGGVEIVTREVYRLLRSAGAEVLVVSAVAGATEPVANVPSRLVKALELSSLTGAQTPLWSRKLRRVADESFNEFDPHVLHACGLHFTSSLHASRIARAHSVPLVTTTHLGSVAGHPAPIRVAAWLYERTLGRAILRSSDRVIAVSHAVEQHIYSLGVESERITVVPNGVDHDRFRPRRASRSSSGHHIVFVGRLIANKGPEVALAALAALNRPSVDLTFVGDGPMRRRLERLAAKLKVSENVRFVGRVADVVPFLSAADIMVQPSRTEGQSLAILEAMASGTCVVASDIPANRELIQNGKNGLTHRPGNPKSLANCLIQVIDDPKLRGALVDQALSAASSHTWDRCAASTADVLKRAAFPEDLS
ncbi:MAG: glycosyltransferase family 4 protein [Acidobacteria bacterium]|nr:glycosyltransferase family 4 protein [Acidobacteriota bacterium]